MTKVYLAKSNKANPDDVMGVRKLLSTYNIEVVEYKGGTYSHKPLNECDLLLILPDLSEIFIDEHETTSTLGKGLFEQVQAYEGANVTNAKTLVIYDSDFNAAPIDCMEPAESEDWINYAYAMLDVDEGGDFKFLLGEILGFSDLDNGKDNKKMYLLINNN